MIFVYPKCNDNCNYFRGCIVSYFFYNYNHLVIWNIPVQLDISEGIKPGKVVDGLGGAVQEIAYGRHKYNGPKPPFKSIHTNIATIKE